MELSASAVTGVSQVHRRFVFLLQKTGYTVKIQTSQLYTLGADAVRIV